MKAKQQHVYGTPDTTSPAYLAARDRERALAAAKAERAAALNELMYCATWVSRCAFINGPVGTKGYLISDDLMLRLCAATARMRELEGG